MSLIKYAHRWNPFVDLEDEEEIWGDKYGVCTLQKWSQRWTPGYLNPELTREIRRNLGPRKLPSEVVFPPKDELHFRLES